MADIEFEYIRARPTRIRVFDYMAMQSRALVMKHGYVTITSAHYVTITSAQDSRARGPRLGLLH